MSVVDSREFDFDGKQYEIRVATDESGYKVAVFLGGKRANPYTYSVDFITDCDIAMKQGFRGYQHLMDVAESDVRERYWEKYQELEKQED